MSDFTCGCNTTCRLEAGQRSTHAHTTRITQRIAENHDIKRSDLVNCKAAPVNVFNADRHRHQNRDQTRDIELSAKLARAPSSGRDFEARQYIHLQLDAVRLEEPALAALSDEWSWRNNYEIVHMDCQPDFKSGSIIIQSLSNGGFDSLKLWRPPLRAREMLLVTDHCGLTRLHCVCLFTFSWRLPCRHILFVTGGRFRLSDIPLRYIVNYRAGVFDDGLTALNWATNPVLGVVVRAEYSLQDLSITPDARNRALPVVAITSGVQSPDVHMPDTQDVPITKPAVDHHNEYHTYVEILSDVDAAAKFTQQDPVMSRTFLAGFAAFRDWSTQLLAGGVKAPYQAPPLMPRGSRPGNGIVDPGVPHARREPVNSARARSWFEPGVTNRARAQNKRARNQPDAWPSRPLSAPPRKRLRTSSKMNAVVNATMSNTSLSGAAVNCSSSSPSSFARDAQRPTGPADTATAGPAGPAGLAAMSASETPRLGTAHSVRAMQPVSEAGRKRLVSVDDLAAVIVDDLLAKATKQRVMTDRSVNAQRSPDWFLYRVGKLSGSFAKAMMGDWEKNPLRLLAEILQLKTHPTTPAMQRGLRMEPKILAMYAAARQGKELAHYDPVINTLEPASFMEDIANKIGIQVPSYNWIQFSRDGVLTNGRSKVLLEVKNVTTVTSRQTALTKWGDQCQLGLMVHQLSHCYLLVCPVEDEHKQLTESDLLLNVEICADHDWKERFMTRAIQFYGTYMSWFHAISDPNSRSVGLHLITQIVANKLIDESKRTAYETVARARRAPK